MNARIQRNLSDWVRSRLVAFFPNGFERCKYIQRIRSGEQNLIKCDLCK